jgi:hypothetical protein
MKCCMVYHNSRMGSRVLVQQTKCKKNLLFNFNNNSIITLGKHMDVEMC